MRVQFVRASWTGLWGAHSLRGRCSYTFADIKRSRFDVDGAAVEHVCYVSPHVQRAAVLASTLRATIKSRYARRDK